MELIEYIIGTLLFFFSLLGLVVLYLDRDKKGKEKKMATEEKHTDNKECARGTIYSCTENDNEIIYNKEDGEFLIGHSSGIGGWVVIGEKDLKLCLMELGITVE